MKLSYDAVLEEMEKLHLALGHFFEISALSKQAGVYHDRLKRWNEQVLKQACREWNLKQFPTANELDTLCYKINQRWQNTAPQGAVGDCRYSAVHGNAANEGVWSRSQCRRWPMTEDQARLSVSQFGVVMCYWHEQVAKSKIWPDGVEVEWVKAMESDSKARDKAPPRHDLKETNVVVAMYNKVAPK